MSDIVERLLEQYPDDYPAIRTVIEKYRADRHDAAAEITRFRAKLAEAEAVIKPFADVGVYVNRHATDAYDNDETSVYIGDLRKAAAWLEGKKGMSGNKNMTDVAAMMDSAVASLVRDFITTAREEGRKAGLEEAANITPQQLGLVAGKPSSVAYLNAINDYRKAILAIKDKEPSK